MESILSPTDCTENSALNLLLGSDITVVTALSLSAVGGLWRESGIAFSANLFLALELSGKGSECRLNLDGTHTSTSESENQVEGGLLLDVVVRESSAILKLLTSENKSLLIWWNTFLILNFGFDVLDGVRWLHIESNCLTRQGLDKNLHIYLSND